ncbi:transposable element Tcb1 transposase [Trichonephila clavipes]|nr:transposable element Tcb1 transposase [Trichonephila clavipes]
MMKCGWSARRVARQLGSSNCVLRKCWNQWFREISFTRKPSSGRSRQTSPREDRQILPRAISQQDNSRSHTVKVSQDCLRNVTTLPWPTRSPNEHSWDYLGRRVGHPTSLNEIEARLQQIWNEMSQDIIQNLYASMPDRIALCIRARSSTGY